MASKDGLGFLLQLINFICRFWKLTSSTLPAGDSNTVMSSRFFSRASKPARETAREEFERVDGKRKFLKTL